MSDAAAQEAYAFDPNEVPPVVGPSSSETAEPGEAVLAADICARYDCREEALARLTDDAEPAAFLQALIDDGLLRDAIAFAARWLDRKQAVWWGCLCAWDVHGDDTAGTDVKAIRACYTWLLDPNDDTRRRAGELAQLAGESTPAGAVAMAVFCSGGSISLPDLPEVSPSADLLPRLVASAVEATASARGAMAVAGRQRQLLQVGVEVALGNNTWIGAAAES